MDYRHSTHHVHLLNYHLVWCPKRRKKILVGAVKHRLHSIIQDVARERGFEIIALEIMPDHLHSFYWAIPLPNLLGRGIAQPFNLLLSNL